MVSSCFAVPPRQKQLVDSSLRGEEGYSSFSLSGSATCSFSHLPNFWVANPEPKLVTPTTRAYQKKDMVLYLSLAGMLPAGNYWRPFASLSPRLLHALELTRAPVRPRHQTPAGRSVWSFTSPWKERAGSAPFQV